MKAGEVAALFAVPVSTVLHWGRTGVLRRIKLGRTAQRRVLPGSTSVSGRLDRPARSPDAGQCSC